MKSDDVSFEKELLIMFPASKNFSPSSENEELDEVSLTDYSELFPASKNYELEAHQDDLISEIIGEEDLSLFSNNDAQLYEEKISELYSNEQLLDRVSVNLQKINEMTNKMKYYMDEIDIFIVK